MREIKEGRTYLSCWTHIVGVLHIDTYVEMNDIQAFVEECLRNAPKITGSESDATIFVNPEPGHCTWISRDCNNCQYKDTIRNYGNGGTCDAPNDFLCPNGEYQSRAIITVCGDLRDRVKVQTKKEWNAFHRYIAKELGFRVRIATCRIDDKGC